MSDVIANYTVQYLANFFEEKRTELMTSNKQLRRDPTAVVGCGKLLTGNRKLFGQCEDILAGLNAITAAGYKDTIPVPARGALYEPVMAHIDNWLKGHKLPPVERYSDVDVSLKQENDSPKAARAQIDKRLMQKRWTTFTNSRA